MSDPANPTPPAAPAPAAPAPSPAAPAPAAPAAPAPAAPAAPAPAAPAAPAPAASLLDPPAAAKPGDPPKVGEWGDDWRARMAGGDADAQRQLERFNDPGAVAKALVEARKALSKAGGAAKLPDNATPEQITEFRKANGIPETVDGYFDKLPDGLVIGEADKPGMTKLAEKLLARNADPALAHDVMQTYYEVQADTVAKMTEANTAAQRTASDALIGEMGIGEYRTAQNVVKSLLEGLPEDVSTAIISARDTNGVQLLNNPGVFKALSAWGRDMNPAATVVPGHGPEQMANLDSEIKAIEATMNAPDANEKYWQNPQAQQRYRDLLTAKERSKAK